MNPQIPLPNDSNLKMKFIFSDMVSECVPSSWLPPAFSWFLLSRSPPLTPNLQMVVCRFPHTLNQLQFSGWNLSHVKMWQNRKWAPCPVIQKDMLLILSLIWKSDRTVNNYTEKHCYHSGNKGISGFVSVYGSKICLKYCKDYSIYISFLIIRSCAVGVNKKTPHCKWNPCKCLKAAFGTIPILFCLFMSAPYSQQNTAH